MGFWHVEKLGFKETAVRTVHCNQCVYFEKNHSRSISVRACHNHHIHHEIDHQPLTESYLKNMITVHRSHLMDQGLYDDNNHANLGVLTVYSLGLLYVQVGNLYRCEVFDISHFP